MKILVALGGNAILQSKEAGTAEQQIANIRRTSSQLVELLKQGETITITHGNGPQVGDILLRNEVSRSVIPPMPLDVCDAESQGMIGYMLQQSMSNELRSSGLDTPVVTIITQTVVDENDRAFKEPTKPIGPFYTEDEALKLARQSGWIVKRDGERGFRRVVPSPKPISIVEAGIIKRMFEERFLLIHSGGGGIPVVKNKHDGSIRGVEAVIDKDLTAGLLASILHVDILLILTDVEKLALNYGKPDQENLDSLRAKEARTYLLEGQFPEGSMGPKVEAALNFLEAGGEKVIIASLKHAKEALEGATGTAIM